MHLNCLIYLGPEAVQGRSSALGTPPAAQRATKQHREETREDSAVQFRETTSGTSGGPKGIE